MAVSLCVTPFSHMVVMRTPARHHAGTRVAVVRGSTMLSVMLCVMNSGRSRGVGAGVFWMKRRRHDGTSQGLRAKKSCPRRSCRTSAVSAAPAMHFPSTSSRWFRPLTVITELGSSSGYREGHVPTTSAPMTHATA